MKSGDETIKNHAVRKNFFPQKFLPLNSLAEVLRKLIMTNSHAYVRISITLLWTDTCVLVLIRRHGMCFWPVVYVQRKWEQKIEKGMAKRSLKEFKDLLVWSFLKTAMNFLCFASCYFSLSCTYQARHRLHGVVAVSLLPFSRQSPSSFFVTLVTIAELPLSPESKTGYVCWQYSVVPAYLGNM